MTRKSRPNLSLGAAALLGLSLAMVTAIAPASADKVGVAAAVKPDAFSSLAGAPQSQLNIGKSIFFNEHIKTTGGGLVQVLLVDGSTFTVGPDSDLTIDRFVYDPNTGTGQIAASFSKGVMRFVGGKISKSDNAVTINTPEGSMAIRGCIVLTQVTQSNFAAVLVFGDYLKMKNLVVYEPGNGIFIAGNGLPQIKPATGGIINGLMAGLSNGTQGNNGDASNKTANAGPKIQLINTGDLTQAVNDANALQITTDAAKAEANQTSAPAPAPLPDLQGYSGGIYHTQDASATQEVPSNHDYGTVANWSASEVKFARNTDGSFTPIFRLHAGDIGGQQGGILMDFGKTLSNPDLGAFSASAGVDAINIFRNDTDMAPILGGKGATLQSTPDMPALCTDCAFLQWGTVSADANFQETNDNQQTVDRNVQTSGFWVAGDIPAVGDLPFTGSATYSGGAVGTVNTDLFGDGAVQTYTARGDMTMGWSFTDRSGNMTISKFDQDHFEGGLTFSGQMCAPGRAECSTPDGNHFGGKLGGQLPSVAQNGDTSVRIPEGTDYRDLNGFALGSFARGPSNYNANGNPIQGSIPEAVIGNWQVGNDHYQASGVFAGKVSVGN